MSVNELESVNLVLLWDTLKTEFLNGSANIEELKRFELLGLNIVLIWLQSKADAFEYADQVLEKWYPSVEEGNNKGIVVLITSQKEGAITGGPAFVQAVGEAVLDATVSENLPGNYAFTLHSSSFNFLESNISC